MCEISEMDLEQILPPSNVTIKVENLISEYKTDLVHDHKVLKHLKLRIMEIEDFIESTMKILNTTIYKNTNRFRKDKGFQGLQMVQKSTEKLQKLNFCQEIQRFREQLPLSSDVYKSSYLYLPTSPSLQYFLIIHLKMFQMCQKILGRCDHACAHLMYRIKLGHFWNWAAFNLANVGRLWTLIQSLMVHLHLSYEFHLKLFEFLPKSSTQWSGFEVNLPKTLIEENSKLRENETIIKLLANNDFPKIEIKTQTVQEILIGEVIERPTEPQMEVKEAKVEVNKKLKLKVEKLLKGFKKVSDIKDFIQSETLERKNSRKDAITKKLEQCQWKELKSSLKSNLEKKSLKELKQIIKSQILYPMKK